MSPEPPGVESPQDLVGLLAQDVRVVERPAELEEGHVEGDRDDDQQECRHDLNRHAVARSVSLTNPYDLASAGPLGGSGESAQVCTVHPKVVTRGGPCRIDLQDLGIANRECQAPIGTGVTRPVAATLPSGPVMT